MFLKSLEIFGFKSFPDRISVDFAEGITALLGPNGCGKSNVIDAIKWCLGEGSYKALRADKMEDVIFSGTQTRAQMNMAEVCLTIDNEAGLLHLDTSEIAIKRRLYRSGENEYFINGESVRLKDIKEMFWDTGVGKAAYSVMEQGKIDQILSSKPEERKYLFEEAAGITKFKIKRLEAQRRLEKTQENVKVLYASLNEVKKQYDVLKVQADKTAKYKELKNEQFGCEIDIRLLKLKKLSEELALKKNDEANLRAEIDDVQKEIELLTSSLSENMDSVNAMQEDFLARQKELLRLDIERREKEDKLLLYVKMEGELQEKIKLNETHLQSSKERLQSTKEEIDEKKGEVLSLSKKYSSIEENIKDFESNISILSTQLASNIEDIQKKNVEIKESENKSAQLSHALHQITEDIAKELDESLRQHGSAIKEKEGEELLHLIEKISSIAKNRSDVIKDYSIISPIKKELWTEFLEKMKASFGDVANIAQKIKENFLQYKEHSNFIVDSFLSPEGIITKKRNIDSRIVAEKEVIDNLKKDIEELENANEKTKLKIEEYKKTLEALRIEKGKQHTQITGIEREISILEKQERLELERCAELEAETNNYADKMQQNIDEKLELEGAINAIKMRGEKLADELLDLQHTIQGKNADLSGSKKKMQEQSAKRVTMLATLEKMQMNKVAFETEIRAIKESFKDTYSRQIEEFEDRMFHISLSHSQLKEKEVRIRGELGAIGSVNFMAIEEFESTKERYEFLQGQVADIEKAQKDLIRITEEIRAESTQLFVATYQKIKKNFHNMFRRLFGGGRAEIRLTEPDNVLDSGIDIFAQPPGKRLENISLLSGGEKSMTAVSLLFATYMVKPAPFCLLDEIDAALDEQNVMRFINTLKEFANVSQYIVITHNKKTVVGANAMLGVTMEESGVSKMIAIKLDANFEELKKEGAIVGEEFEEEEVEEEVLVIPSRPAKRIKEDIH